MLGREWTEPEAKAKRGKLRRKGGGIQETEKKGTGLS